MTAQSFLCRLGLHRWKEVWRVYWLRGWLCTPPATNGVMVYPRAEKCTVCGKRRSA